MGRTARAVLTRGPVCRERRCGMGIGYAGLALACPCVCSAPCLPAAPVGPQGSCAGQPGRGRTSASCLGMIHRLADWEAAGIKVADCRPCEVAPRAACCWHAHFVDPLRSHLDSHTRGGKHTVTLVQHAWQGTGTAVSSHTESGARPGSGAPAPGRRGVGERESTAQTIGQAILGMRTVSNLAVVTIGHQGVGSGCQPALAQERSFHCALPGAAWRHPGLTTPRRRRFAQRSFFRLHSTDHPQPATKRTGNAALEMAGVVEPTLGSATAPKAEASAAGVFAGRRRRAGAHRPLAGTQVPRPRRLRDLSPPPPPSQTSRRRGGCHEPGFRGHTGAHGGRRSRAPPSLAELRRLQRRRQPGQ